MMASIKIFRASCLLRGLRVTYKTTSTNNLYLCQRFASSSSSSSTPTNITTPITTTKSNAIEDKTASTTTPPNENTDLSNLSFDGLPVNIKWESTAIPDIGILADQAIEITGAIIPFAQQNILQNIFFPYQYPIMHYLDFLVGYCPWWLGIVATTATVRLLFFPLVVKMNIIGIKISNIMPETQQLQVQMNEAMLTGDAYKSAIARTKLKLLYEKNNVKLSQRLLPTLIQSPAFLCLFFTLKNLAGYYKIPALMTGGALWFTDLTMADPFYLLPVMTSLSMWLLLEYGIEGSSGPLKTMGPVGRWALRAFPIGLFFIFQGFPTAVLLFWTTNNFITLSYAILLKQKWVKKIFNIPIRIEHDPASLPLTNQSFNSQFSKGIAKAKGTRTTLDLRKLDDIAFQKAGIGPLRKTYKEPPPSFGKEDSK